jgi:hypothetical protein
LAYRNNVAVIPGQTYTVIVGGGVPVNTTFDPELGYSQPGNGAGTGGAVRIIWGLNRSFPSTNTGDV